MNIAIIPARIGSKRIPKKNIKIFYGKPIIYYAIKNSINSGLFDKVVVSTDSVDIKKIVEKFNAEVPFIRNKKLSNDNVDTDSVIIDTLEFYKRKKIFFEYACCVYPITPLLDFKDLIKGYKKIIHKKSTSLFPIYKANDLKNKIITINKKGVMEYNSNKSRVSYNDAGQYYWINVKKYIKEKKLWSKNSIPVIYQKNKLIDVNTIQDWEKLKKMYKKNTSKPTQEKFWQGEFGNKYSNRNDNIKLINGNKNLFKLALKNINKKRIKSVLEIGANIGNNLKVLKKIIPNCEFHANEINNSAANKLKKIIPEECIYNSSIKDLNINKKFDLVLSKGVLIHINPLDLNSIYKKINSLSSKYILFCEYYNPKPININYRGFSNKLFKRDFAGEFLNKYRFQLVDYGFVYKNDPKYPLDDINWFLLKKM